jgi:hypothetical protein
VVAEKLRLGMVNAQLLVEIDLDGETAGPELPMGAGQLEDLRWYLEDYLQMRDPDASAPLVLRGWR